LIEESMCKKVGISCGPKCDVASIGQSAAVFWKGGVGGFMLGQAKLAQQAAAGGGPEK